MLLFNEALPFCPSLPRKGGGGAKWQSFVRKRQCSWLGGYGNCSSRFFSFFPLLSASTLCFLAATLGEKRKTMDTNACFVWVYCQWLPGCIVWWSCFRFAIILERIKYNTSCILSPGKDFSTNLTVQSEGTLLTNLNGLVNTCENLCDPNQNKSPAALAAFCAVKPCSSNSEESLVLFGASTSSPGAQSLQQQPRPPVDPSMASRGLRGPILICSESVLGSVLCRSFKLEYT